MEFVSEFISKDEHYFRYFDDGDMKNEFLKNNTELFPTSITSRGGREEEEIVDIHFRRICRHFCFADGERARERSSSGSCSSFRDPYVDLRSILQTPGLA